MPGLCAVRRGSEGTTGEPAFPTTRSTVARVALPARELPELVETLRRRRRFFAGYEHSIVARDVGGDVEGGCPGRVEAVVAQRCDAHRADGKWKDRDLHQFVRVLRNIATADEAEERAADGHCVRPPLI